MYGIRAYLIDLTALARESLTAVLEAGGVEVIDHNAAEGTPDKCTDAFAADLAIADCSVYPKETLAPLLEDLRLRFANCYLVALIDPEDVEGLAVCLHKNLDGAVATTVSGPVFIKILHVIVEGERYFQASVIPTEGTLRRAGATEDNNPDRDADMTHLSRREKRILNQLAAGESNKAIASNLGCAEATIKVHMKRILRKLRVNNRTQAAVWALNNGVSPDRGISSHELRHQRRDTASLSS